MNTTSDLNYIENGLFISFIPNTKDGEYIFRTMYEQNGSATIQYNHLGGVLRQIRKAGYSVTKAKKSTETLDDILNSDWIKELGI